MAKLSNADKKTIQALQEQLEDSMRMSLKYKIPGKNKSEERRPLFISLRIKDITDYQIEMVNGAVAAYDDGRLSKNHVVGELRVGDYYDGCSKEKIDPSDSPIDNNTYALKQGIWLEMNKAMYEAVKQFNTDINKSIGVAEEFCPYSYFSKEDPVKYINPAKKTAPNMNYWEDTLKRVSELFYRGGVIHSCLDFEHNYEKRFYVNSEGTVIVDTYTRSKISIGASILGKDNLILNDYVRFYVTDINQLPDEDILMTAAENLVTDLYELREVPQENAGTYPTIVDCENHGVIWHEAIGHSLEGNRQNEDDDSGDYHDSFIALTFKDKIDQQVAPRIFISI